MKILIVGSGGREHAIAWKLKENKNIEKIFIAPGNAGIDLLPNTESLSLNNNIKEYADFAEKNKIDLTIVGSEELLVQGIVDEFKNKGLKIFGPDKKAAILEGSKAYSKDFMKKYGIKTAKYEIFDNYEKAQKYLDSYRNDNFPVVIKTSGLAAGKGVIIVKNLKEAKDAVTDIMINKKFGTSGEKIVIEEYLEGIEASILSFTDCKTIVPLISAKDHKKIGESETGLNTGGMGAISPNPYVTESIFKEFTEKIMKPTLKGIQNEDMDFAGVIFFGLMITKKGVYLLEYNMRMGDPETQAVLPLLETNLYQIIEKSFEKKLNEVNIKWKSLHSCCVVATAEGYPEQYRKGDEISGILKEKNNDELLFICGVKKENSKFVTSGGRVLNITCLGNTLEEARKKAYNAMKNINFKGMYYRKDIGKI
ncbi:phosphoribosylamine--glycine ligase [Leptotrichia sp. OH3620_COT-345]|uniref:phosphoribosylamine--glycine ligase n=1 Tax=Leptotrichia sp. OH3620_COT-345 TaxID=2491048 RepID=UPI000F64DA61|nr:phosphoribosylamine--glycine ligase [Leptotrichia sp. OH3620_COT-345]RRD39022.1 phosphoribosylamine--glycine ligase [Leptotrichia sp. OH3620_COT-345]